MKKLIFILLLIPYLLSAQTTYYVASGGDNANDGSDSTANAFATLTYAAANVSSPDIIHLCTGSWEVDVAIAWPVGVSLVGNDALSIITTTVDSPEWSGVVQALLYLKSVSMTDGAQSISHIAFDGASLYGARALWILHRNNVIIHHCTFTDFHYQGLVWAGEGGSFVDNIYNVGTVPPTNYATGSEFYNNTITNCAHYSGTGRGGLTLKAQEDMLIHDNTITQTGRATGANGYPVKMSWINGLKFYDNIVLKGDVDDYGFAIEMAFVIYGGEFYGNTITGAIDLNQIAKGDYDYGAYIHDNTLGPATPNNLYYSGIILEMTTQDVIIEKNHFRNGGEGITYTPRANDTVSNHLISANVFDKIGNETAGSKWGIIRLWYGADVIKMQGYFRIYNNTMFVDEDDPRWFNIGLGGFSEGNEISIVNNIITGAQGYGIHMESLDNVTTLNIKNNVFYDNGSSNAYDLSGTPDTYVNTDNVVDNPDFTTPGSDYTLTAPSPAIGAGFDVGLNTDYAGDSYKSPPSIGAYAYDSSPPSPNPATVTTTAATAVKSVRATAGGNVTDIGGSAVTTRGVCWSTSASPDITDNIVPSGSGTGAFSCTLTGLSNSTLYYIRAYAENGETAYGAQESFTTPAYSSVTSGGVIVLDDSGNPIIIE